MSGHSHLHKPKDDRVAVAEGLFWLAVSERNPMCLSLTSPFVATEPEVHSCSNGIKVASTVQNMHKPLGASPWPLLEVVVLVGLLSNGSKGRRERHR